MFDPISGSIIISISVGMMLGTLFYFGSSTETEHRDTLLYFHERY